DYLRTTVEHIWAVGDINGRQPFTRVAQEEGNAAFANAFEGASLRVPRERIPHAIFTDPEAGSVGSTEAEAREQGIEVAAMTISAHQVTRAFLSGREAGLLKFIVDARS